MKYCTLFLVASQYLSAQNCIPASRLAPNDSQAGELTSTTCQLSDGTKIAEYSLTLPVRGTLQLTVKATGFTPLLMVRNREGRKMETGSSVQRYLEAGIYHVLVNGGDPGKFTLSSTFQPEQNVLCTAFEKLGSGQNTAGQLGASSCKLPDGRAFDGWQTTVFGAGTLTITMRAAAFDSFLILRSENGTLLGFDDNGDGGRDARISLKVSGRETYTILAAAATATGKGGAYRISTIFEPDDEETCRPVGIFTEAAQFNGSISTASCNFNLPERQDSSLFNVHGIHVPQDGVVQLTVPNSTFTPLLLVLDRNGNSIVEDSESGGLFTPLIRQPLTAGEYSVLIFNQDSFEGEYTLQYSFMAGPAQPCRVETIRSGQTVNGVISGESTCRQPELLSDAFRIVLPSAAVLDAGLASGEFTTFMELRDAKDNLLAYSDSSQDGSSAHLQLNLPAGTYLLQASSADLPGRYSLTAQMTPKTLPSCPAGQILPVNTGFFGKLGEKKCTSTAGEPVDLYRFITTAAGTVALVMTSGDLDSHLTLTDNSGKILRFDDNSYSEGDSIIVHYLNAGTYRVEARGRNLNGSGRYRLDLLWTGGAKPLYCAATPLSPGTMKNATLTYTGCQYYDNTFANFYGFRVSDPTKPIEISAASAKIDSYLILMDSVGNIIAADDNSGGGTAASLSQLLDIGLYYLVFKPATNATESGDYHIQIQQ